MNQITTTEVKTSEISECETIDTCRVLNLKAIEDMRQIAGEDADSFLSNIIDCYLEDAPVLIKSLDTAFAAQDAATLRRTAHSLKSTSATLGATYLAQICRELETLPPKQALLAKAHITLIEVEYRKVQAALQIEYAKYI